MELGNFDSGGGKSAAKLGKSTLNRGNSGVNLGKFNADGGQALRLQPPGAADQRVDSVSMLSAQAVTHK
jgi:hypothetical protein